MNFFSSQVGGESKTTFDDLLESLKQLEEEPAALLPMEENSAPKFGGWGKNLSVKLITFLCSFHGTYEFPLL